MAHQVITPWQRIKSYFTPQRLEVTESAYTPILEVILSDGRCMLNSPDATYSFEDKYTSFRAAIHAVRKRLPEYSEILVLGLGLGSVPYMLQTTFKYKGRITCVEIDPVVVKLAERYYPDKRLYGELKVHTTDAVSFIKENTDRYGAIFCDIFIDKRVPEALHSAAFMRDLRRAIAPGGTLLFSRLASERKAEVTLWENLKLVFPEAENIDTGGNHILNYQAAKK